MMRRENTSYGKLRLIKGSGEKVIYVASRKNCKNVELVAERCKVLISLAT